MRWKEKEDDRRDNRIVKAYCFWPVKVGKNWVWLEIVYIYQARLYHMLTHRAEGWQNESLVTKKAYEKFLETGVISRDGSDK